MQFKPGAKTAAIGLVAITACCADTLAAEVPVPRDTVATRVRSELRAQGVRAGAFEVYPSLTVGFDRNDNIYAQPVDPLGDTIMTVAPRVDVRSNWSRHALEVGARAQLGRYADFQTEDYDDVEAYAAGRLELSDRRSFKLAGRLGSLHENRFSPDDRNGLTPTRFRRASYTVGYEQRAGQVSLQLAANLGRLDYRDTPGDPVDINQDDRDRDWTDASLQVDYAVSPRTTLFVKGSIGSIDYDDTVDDQGFARSSDNQQFAVGADLELGARTSLSGFVGGTRRDFDDARFETLDTAWFSGTLNYRLSGLTTLSATVGRDVGDTIQDGASGTVTTTYAASVDHELLRNLILKLRVAKQDVDFVSIERRDDVLDAQFEMHYMVNRRFDLLLGVRTLDRDVANGLVGDESFRTDNFTLDLRGKL